MISFIFQCQDVYPELMEDLQKLVASPMVTENEFPSTFLSGMFYNEMRFTILSLKTEQFIIISIPKLFPPLA